MELRSKIYIALSVLVISLIAGLLIWIIILYSGLRELNEKYQDNQEQIQKIQKYQASQNNRGPRGSPGERGPQGPVGKSGGTNLSHGPMRNLESNGAYVVDRLHGIGTASVAFLNKLSYQPNQIWTHQSNFQLSNQYGNCLEGDPNTGDVYMAGCDSNSLKQKWKSNTYGQMILEEGGDCLDVSLEDQFSGSNKIVRGSKLGKDSTHFNLRRLKLKKCDKPNSLKASQQFVFV